jgi:hypothetical protein
LVAASKFLHVFMISTQPIPKKREEMATRQLAVATENWIKISGAGSCELADCEIEGAQLRVEIPDSEGKTSCVL